ncbi:MAG: ATP-binding cassette domain-containing protein [Clostridia bacterium]|nr:ATP-binding cassette domain-containing protein [Clostridia bacterium]
MIEVKNLSKKYGSHVAVNDVSFTINDGEILGFLGPNGAGKSTTMNIVTGYLSATSGSVAIDGYDILENPNEAKMRIGYLPEQPPLYLDMTVKEYLSFIFDLKKVKFPKGPHIDEICKLVKIDHVKGRLIKNLSKGYRQRVGIAQALVGNPDVLILDEPTVGLDPKQIIEIRTLITELGKNHTVILSSHILSEIQAVCERVIVINRGKIIADDTPGNLSKTLSDDHTLTVRIGGPRTEVLKTLATIQGVKNVTCIGMQEKNSNDFIIEPEGQADVRRSIFNRLAERNWPLMLMQSNELSLEQIFLRLTEMSDEEQQKLFGKDTDWDDEDDVFEDIEDEVTEASETSENITEGEDK